MRGVVRSSPVLVCGRDSWSFLVCMRNYAVCVVFVWLWHWSIFAEALAGNLVAKMSTFGRQRSDSEKSSCQRICIVSRSAVQMPNIGITSTEHSNPPLLSSIQPAKESQPSIIYPPKSSKSRALEIVQLDCCWCCCLSRGFQHHARRDEECATLQDSPRKAFCGPVKKLFEWGCLLILEGEHCKNCSTPPNTTPLWCSKCSQGSVERKSRIDSFLYMW